MFVSIRHPTVTLPLLGVEIFIKVVFIFILYLIIVYFTQFSPLLSELNPSAEHSVHFENYPTSLLWYSSEILYTPFWRTEIDPIRSSLSAVCNIPHTIEGYSYHQFFPSDIDRSR